MESLKIMTNAEAAAAGKRPLYVIAREIGRNWRNMYFGAVPYWEAMGTMDKIEDNYFEDSGVSVVLYFLANANTWRGPVAREIKAELKKMAGVK